MRVFHRLSLTPSWYKGRQAGLARAFRKVANPEQDSISLVSPWENNRERSPREARLEVGPVASHASPFSDSCLTWSHKSTSHTWHRKFCQRQNSIEHRSAHTRKRKYQRYAFSNPSLLFKCHLLLLFGYIHGFRDSVCINNYKNMHSMMALVPFVQNEVDITEASKPPMSFSPVISLNNQFLSQTFQHQSLYMIISIHTLC